MFQIYDFISTLPFPFLLPFSPLLPLQQSLRLPLLVTPSLSVSIFRIFLCSAISQSEFFRTQSRKVLAERSLQDSIGISVNNFETLLKSLHTCVFQLTVVPFEREFHALQLSPSASPRTSSVSCVIFVLFFSPCRCLMCPGNYTWAIRRIIREI